MLIAYQYLFFNTYTDIQVHVRYIGQILVFIKQSSYYHHLLVLITNLHQHLAKDEIFPHVEIVFQVKRHCLVEIKKRFCVPEPTFHTAWLHLAGENNRAD